MTSEEPWRFTAWILLLLEVVLVVRRSGERFVRAGGRGALCAVHRPGPTFARGLLYIELILFELTAFGPPDSGAIQEARVKRVRGSERRVSLYDVRHSSDYHVEVLSFKSRFVRPRPTKHKSNSLFSSANPHTHAWGMIG